jgi:spermidine synthase
MVYGCCNLGIAAFPLTSRFLFYDLLFLRLQYLAQSLPVTLGIVFLSLLVPTVLMASGFTGKLILVYAPMQD